MTADGLPVYIHIDQNDFFNRKHKKQKEEDIAICNCKYDVSDPDSACGDGCLNVLTSTECTPGYCPCDTHCRNQRFQKSENAKSKLFKTEGRGWGLLADENIKAGQFIIEYCGEVISCKEAKRRSHAYERLGLLDAYIISLNASESIDATKKGSFARFINHSCFPNCETRKWTVLGEIRVGIFAKQDIPLGTELAYNYNFEWYGGAKVRCLCGAPCCFGFLGAKSRGFQEDTYLWDDDDDRYSVENIPTYDSEEDEPTSKLSETPKSSELESSAPEKRDTPVIIMDENMEDKQSLQSNALSVEQQSSAVPMDENMEDTQHLQSNALSVEQQSSAVPREEVVKAETETKIIEETTMLQQAYSPSMMTVSRIRNNTASPSPKKRSLNYNGRSKQNANKVVDAKRVAQLLVSKEAGDEVYNYEETKKQAASELDSVYDDIRPAIEEHERDSQDNVSTSVAERWIEANCSKMKADFDFYSSIIKNVALNFRKPGVEVDSVKGEGENDVKLLTN